MADKRAIQAEPPTRQGFGSGAETKEGGFRGLDSPLSHSRTVGPGGWRLRKRGPVMVMWVRLKPIGTHTAGLRGALVAKQLARWLAD